MVNFLQYSDNTHPVARYAMPLATDHMNQQRLMLYIINKSHKVLKACNYVA